MNRKVAPVLFCRARALVTFGMFFEISVGQGLERAGRGLFTLCPFSLDWIRPSLNLRRHRAGTLASILETGCGIGADGGAQRFTAVRMAETEGKGPRPVRCDSQDKSGLTQICNFQPATVWWLCATQRIGQNL